jgi:hypothetical protein
MPDAQSKTNICLATTTSDATRSTASISTLRIAKGQIIMSPIRRPIERQRQKWPLRKRAKPFAFLAGYAPDLPNRQFEPNQTEQGRES